MSKLPLRTVSLHLPGSGLMQCKMRGALLKDKQVTDIHHRRGAWAFFQKGLGCWKELSSVHCHKIPRQICFDPLAEKAHHSGFMKE